MANPGGTKVYRLDEILEMDNSDFVLVVKDQEIYRIRKDTLVSNLIGPKGDQGDVGPTGPTGPQGEPGTPAVTSIEVGVACSDETTELSTGAAVATFRMPFAMTVTEVRASLTTASSSGAVTIDINESGSSILSTLLTIDQGAKTSTTATTPAVISDASLADDAEIKIDIDGAGSGAAGLKIWLIGERA